MSIGTEPTPPPAVKSPEWLTVKQVALRLQISPDTVYRGVRDGSLRHGGGGVRGRRVRIQAAWADEWWENR